MGVAHASVFELHFSQHTLISLTLKLIKGSPMNG